MTNMSSDMIFALTLKIATLSICAVVALAEPALARTPCQIAARALATRHLTQKALLLKLRTCVRERIRQTSKEDEHRDTVHKNMAFEKNRKNCYVFAAEFDRDERKMKRRSLLQLAHCVDHFLLEMERLRK